MITKEKKQTILESAEHIFSEHGFFNTSIALIIEQAGIARGTFYLHFDGKKEVFYSLIENFLSDIDKEIFHIDISSKDTPYYQIRKNITNLMSLFYKKRKLTKIILNYAYGIDKDIDSKIDIFYNSIISLIEDALTKGIDLGIIRSCNTYTVSLCILGTIKELVASIISNKVSFKKCEDFADDLLDFTLNGILLSE